VLKLVIFVTSVNDLDNTTNLSRTRYRQTERLLCCVFWTHLHTLDEQFLMSVGLVASMWRYEVIQGCWLISP